MRAITLPHPIFITLYCVLSIPRQQTMKRQHLPVHKPTYFRNRRPSQVYIFLNIYRVAMWPLNLHWLATEYGISEPGPLDSNQDLVIPTFKAEPWNASSGGTVLHCYGLLIRLLTLNYVHNWNAHSEDWCHKSEHIHPGHSEMFASIPGYVSIVRC